MKIEIVSHCYAAELPHYASALCYQLSSLLLNRPAHCEVSATVCCCHSDARTEEVLLWFMQNTNLKMKTIVLSTPGELGRRSIGRNMAAKGSDANVVWFADCDMAFGAGCLDLLELTAKTTLLQPSSPTMIFPEWIWIHQDHATGDRETQKIDKPRLVDLDQSLFVPKRYNRAIGGVQIVSGDFAREHGYLDGDASWQAPAAKPFGDFRDDVAYRKFCDSKGGVKSVLIPGVYRIRHSTTTYQPPTGTKA